MDGASASATPFNPVDFFFLPMEEVTKNDLSHDLSKALLQVQEWFSSSLYSDQVF